MSEIEDLQKKLEKYEYIINEYNICLNDIKNSLNKKDKISMIKKDIDNYLGMLEILKNSNMTIDDVKHITKEIENKKMEELLKKKEKLEKL